MQELSIQQCSDISGGNHKPDVGTLLIAVSLGALWGALSGVVAGPAGMFAGAVRGGFIGATAVMCNDGYQISKDHPR